MAPFGGFPGRKRRSGTKGPTQSNAATAPARIPDASEQPLPLAVQGEVVDSYRVPDNAEPDSSAEVFIVDRESFGQYIVRLPFLTKKESEALALLKDNLRNAIPVEVAGSPQQILQSYLWKTAEKAGLLDIVGQSHRKFLYYLLKDFAGFWEIDPLINDDQIEEISLSRADKPVRVFHRKFTEYMFMETNIVYPSEERLQAFIRRLAQFGGTNISLAQPSLEVVLHGASDRRVSATLGDEISRPGSTYAIRKQKEKPLTIVQLAAPEPARPYPLAPPLPPESVLTYGEDHAHKTLTALMGAYFWLLLEKTTNVLVAGETSSGKTVLMNAILALMNPKAKVVTAEEVLEINLPGDLHWQRLQTRSHRTGMSSMSSNYDLSDLLKLALRFSPTILSLGEMRGEESETVAAAITLGFSTVTTVHAEDAERCVQRVTTPPMRFKEGHVRDITSIVTMRKITLPDGKMVRRVVSIDEIRPVGSDSHEIVNVFKYNFAGDSFSPATPEEVFERSYRLKKTAESFGWTNEQVLRSLTNRAAYIATAVAHGEFSAEALSSMVRSYVARETPRELVRPGS
jgi:flagellar protein FlaI